MLITVIRFAFVFLATLIGTFHADYFTGSALPPWAGGVVGFAVAVTLIAAEQAFRRRFTRSLVAFVIGLAAGLALSLLLIAALRVVISDRAVLDQLEKPLALIVVYLVVVLVVQNADRLRLIVPFVEFKSEQQGGGRAVLDPEALADARLRGLGDAGLVGLLVAHRSALALWEARLGDADPLQQARARRALAAVAELRAAQPPRLEVDESELPGSADASDAAVRLARLLGLRLLTADGILADRCRAEGLAPLHLPALVLALTPPIRPGDTLTVAIARAGEARGQGIGHLDDGSMVVVAGAGEAIGQPVVCTVQRLHATANGRMIFAERTG